MKQQAPKPVYELSISVMMEWQAHSLSNRGSNGSNRLLPRRQLLADGTEVDALSGSIEKHYHAMLLARYFEAEGISLCPACARLDSARAGALSDQPNLSLDSILTGCGMCDTHGFLVTSKRASSKTDEAGRQGLNKHSLLEFSFGLGLPEHQHETGQIHTRRGAAEGAGQMIFTEPSRSAQYGMCIRYNSAGIGVDTETWRVIVADGEERVKRHRAILNALRDCILSPGGARTAAKLPHCSGLKGVVMVQRTPGRAPIYSPLDREFVTLLSSLGSPHREAFAFNTITEFNAIMTDLIAHSEPYLPGSRVKAEATPATTEHN